MPAPVNTQIEEAFWTDPPWDQTTAGNEEYEEYEEEGYEETAYHQGQEHSAKQDYEFGVLYQQLDESSLSGFPQAGVTNEVINKAMQLCQTLGYGTRVACSRFINYILKMSRRTMKRVGSIALAGGDIAGSIPIPNAVLSLLAKVGGAYLEALGKAMLSAAEMPGKGGCTLSFHTVKLPFVGDTGVPDGAYSAICH